MLKYYLTCILAALVLASPVYATNGNRLRLIYIAPAAALPANQTFNAGTLTRAGMGGCNDSSVGGSYAFSNINYTGTHAASLVFSANSTKTSADGVWFIDSHNCLVPKGTYGGAPAQPIVTATYVVTDTFGATGNVNVVAIANRWDVTNVDACPSTCTGNSAPTDSVSTNQFKTLMQGNPQASPRTGPAPGDTVALRCGTVIGPPFLGSSSTTTGVMTPGDIRVQRAAMSGAQEAMFTAFTAFTVPDANWIQVTSDTCSGTAPIGTIRHVQFNGTSEVVQGLWFKGLNFELDYDGLHGYSQSTTPLAIGTGSTTQSFIRVSNSTFQGKNPFLVHADDQRGQVGVFTTQVGVAATGSISTTAGGTVTFTTNPGTLSVGQAISGSGVSFAHITGSITQWTGATASALIDVSQTVTSRTLGVGGSGISGCTTATVAYFDNAGNAVQHGSGATAHATISGGEIRAWVQDTPGLNYDSNSIGFGNSHAGQGTYATVTSDCGTTAGATPNVNGLDIITGIASFGFGKNTEFYIHDNTFTDMFDGLNLIGNQNVAYATSTNFWIIGNTFDRQWTASIQMSAAAPAYTRWNFTKNIKWASGFFHPDCEIRLFSTLVGGSTYPYGDDIGNICVRANGQATWGDAQGWFMSNSVNGNSATGSISTTAGGTVTFTTNPGVTLAIGQLIAGPGVTAGTVITGVTAQWPNGGANNAIATVNNSQTVASETLWINPAIMSGCVFEGNIYVGTFANGITLANCDSSAVAAFNTLVQDPAAGIVNLNQFGSAGGSSASIVGKYSGSMSFNGQSSYNAVAGGVYVWTGGSPTATCNVPSIGSGLGAGTAYAATSLDFTTLTSVAAVSTAFQPKAAGTLVAANLPNAGNPGGSCIYNAGTGGYFDYTNRISTAPF